MSTAYRPDLLDIDAKNRALRTFLVGLTIDAAVAVSLVITETLNAAGEEVDWRLLAALALKTLVASAGSYILRRYADPSNFPTPLPPNPPGEPTDHTPGA